MGLKWLSFTSLIIDMYRQENPESACPCVLWCRLSQHRAPWQETVPWSWGRLSVHSLQSPGYHLSLSYFSLAAVRKHHEKAMYKRNSLTGALGFRRWDPWFWSKGLVTRTAEHIHCDLKVGGREKARLGVVQSFEPSKPVPNKATPLILPK